MVFQILSKALAFHGFPSFFGLLVGLSTLLQPLLKLLGGRLTPLHKYWLWQRHQRTLIRFLSTLVAAWSTFQVLQTPSQAISTDGEGPKECASQTPAGTCIATSQESAASLRPKQPIALAGRTIDLSTSLSSSDSTSVCRQLYLVSIKLNSLVRPFLLPLFNRA